MILRGRPLRRPAPAGTFFIAVSLACLLIGASMACRMWWTSDDAFISFRYARNLVEGLGLVFNAGERVEGFTNFLWTIWVAAGLAAGRDAEVWANVWGILFYLASIVLLAVNQRSMARRPGAPAWILPVAALGAALHRDWAAFATGGLETSLFTFLLLSGFLIVAWRDSGLLAPGLAGLVFALASLTRPDGVLPAFAVGVVMLGAGRARARSAGAYALGFCLLSVPFLAWRIHYYGDIVPTSYYAKSAGLAWYAQGLRYLQLYLETYWALLAGPALLAIVWLLLAARAKGGPSVRPGADRPARRQVILAAAIAVPYALYIVRVGGDFMFARLLIPVTPFLLVILEAAFNRLARLRPAAAWGIAAATLAAMGLSPPPVTGIVWRYGIANEPMYYTGEVIGYIDHASRVLEDYFDGLPVRVAFYGTEARLAYKARFAVAIEAETALTEPGIARQPLVRRGRVGHEKPPSARYLILDRKADFTFSRVPQENIQLFRHIPDVRVKFDDMVYGQLLRWNAPLLESLRRRGATIQDFPAELDAYIARMEALSAEQVAADFERFELFYFSHAADPARKEALLRRLAAR